MRHFSPTTYFLFGISLALSSLAYAQRPGFGWVQTASGGDGAEGLGLTVAHNGTCYFIANSHQMTQWPSGVRTDVGYDMLGTFAAPGSMGWITHIGPAQCIALDSAGNIYIAGRFGSPFNPDPHPLDTHNASEVKASNKSGIGIFVAKYAPNGWMDWCIPINAGGARTLDGLAADKTGHLFIAGTYADTGEFGTLRLPSKPNRHIFYAQLDATSGSINWAKAIAGSGEESCGGLILDTAGRPILIASTLYWYDTVSMAGLSYAPNSASSLVVLKLDASGNGIWMNQISVRNGAAVLALGQHNAVYLAGTCVISAIIDGETAQYNAFYLAKLDSNGKFIWHRLFYGATAMQAALTPVVAATDPSDNLYIGGQNLVEIVLDGDTVGSPILQQAPIIYAGKFDATGHERWSLSFGGRSTIGNPPCDMVTGIGLDNSGRVFLEGNLFTKSDDTASIGSSKFAQNTNGFFLTQLSEPAASVAGHHLVGGMSIALSPNPLTDRGQVTIELTTNSQVQISVVDQLGRERGVIANAELPAGSSTFVFDGARLGTGTYYLRVASDRGESITPLIALPN